jgi:isocitrate dehydrogenase kinase/phosphatase
MTPEWWNQVKENIVDGDLADVFPYPKKRRFKYRWKGGNGSGVRF